MSGSRCASAWIRRSFSPWRRSRWRRTSCARTRTATRPIATTQAVPAHNSYQAAGADVNWAVLDSGIHWTHPHFNGPSGGTIARVYDCTDATQRRGANSLRELDKSVYKDGDAAKDLFGHGAHVAGIIAGRYSATDSDGKKRILCGMAPDAKLVIYKVLDNNG